jgi:fructokinase
VTGRGGQARFLVVGEALVDIVVPAAGTPERAPGGSPLNVAVGLSRLGFPTTLATQIGDDDLGRLVEDHLEASGVCLAGDAVVAGSPTSTATATIDEQGAASYSFDLRWALPRLPVPQGTSALHVGSLGAALRPGRESVLAIVTQAAEDGLPVSFDPNARPALTPDPAEAWADVEQVASLADVVKLSDEDLAFLRPDRDPPEVARSLLSRRTRLVVVTFGGVKAFAASGDAAVEVPSSPAAVVDTVGAGDSFMAALLAVVAEHGLESLDVQRLAGYLAAAHQAAAITVSRRGADPPWRSELPTGWPQLR